MKNKKYDKKTVDMRQRYVNPFTDFGFKKLFGEEASKPQLIDFLNSLLPEQNRIRDLTFKNNEQMPSIDRQRACVYDLHCEGDRGERFIVELQKIKYDHFKERLIFYSTFPIRDQVEKGEQSFKFNPVFSVAILDYKFSDHHDDKDCIQKVQLKNQKNQIFSDKLHYIYIEMPKFNKKVDDVNSHLEKWLYFLKHLNDFEKIPELFKDERIFLNAFEKAEIANFTPEEFATYQASVKIERDLNSAFATAVAQGRADGMAQGMAEGRLEESRAIAKKLKSEGVDISFIVKMTGLTEEEIRKL